MDSNHQGRRKRRMMKIYEMKIMSIKDNDVDENIVYGCADDPNMPNLEEIVYLNEDEDVGAEADMINLDTNNPVSPIPTTRIHKDHPVKQIIKDIHSAPQTRRMTKIVTNYGIDYKEVFAPVARIEAIKLFLAYALFKDFVVYQMDVESAFLHGKIEEEVYVCQPSGFEDPEFPNRVYKEMCIEFEKMMHKKFKISSIGDLTFFLRLQVTWKNDGIFISRDNYVDEILKKFGFTTVKTASTPMETSKPLIKDENAKDVDVHLYRSMIGSLTYLKGQPKLGLWYPKDSPFDLEAYTDSDYAGASLDRKSTTREVGEGSGQPTKPQPMPTTASPSHIIPIPTVTSSSQSTKTKKHRKTKRKATEISQSSGPTTLVADETVYEERRERVERAAATASSLEAERVFDLVNVNDAQALEITHLKKRVKRLEKKTKSRTLQLKRRLFKVRIKSSTEKSLDAKTHGKYDHDIEVNTASTSITTASINLTAVGPVTIVSAPVTNVDVSVSTAEPNKGKGIMQEPKKPVKVKSKDQIALDEEVARRLEAQMQAEFKEEERINSYIPIDSKVLEGSGKKAKSSGKEAVSKKRTEEEFDQESSKRQKTNESSKLAKEPRDKEADELSQEEL
nr:hypothetical protein [Tanacetum cinerariifolium]